MCRLEYILCSNQGKSCNYIHGEIVVICDGEISQFTKVHVPSSNGIHDEDIRGETQGATCRLEAETHKLLLHLDKTSCPYIYRLYNIGPVKYSNES